MPFKTPGNGLERRAHKRMCKNGHRFAINTYNFTMYAQREEVILCVDYTRWHIRLFSPDRLLQITTHASSLQLVVVQWKAESPDRPTATGLLWNSGANGPRPTRAKGCINYRAQTIYEFVKEKWPKLKISRNFVVFHVVAVYGAET